MREIWFVHRRVALLFLTALAAAFPAAAQSPPASADAASLLQVTPQDRVLGQADAPITIVEYASMTCPHCAHFANEVLPELKKKWIDTGKAKLVMRPFPLDQVALRAEMLARCLPPERYYPMIETLFKTQEKWAVAAGLARRARTDRAARRGRRARSSTPVSRTRRWRTRSCKAG